MTSKTTATVPFRALPVGATFEFDRGDLRGLCTGMSTGPWRKVSARCYVRVTDGMRCQVGTLKVGVVPCEVNG